MSARCKTSRTQVWLDNLGEWTWPGGLPPARRRRRGAPAGLGPHAATRACPASAGGRRGGAPGSLAARAATARRRRCSARCAVAVPCARARGPARPRAGIEGVAPARLAASTSPDRAGAAAGRCVAGQHRRAGSSIVHAPATRRPRCAARAPSTSTCRPGSTRRAARRATRCSTCCTATTSRRRRSWKLGLQGELDRLIAAHAIPPLIAVMIQGGRRCQQLARPAATSTTKATSLEVQETHRPHAADRRRARRAARSPATRWAATAR